jgi:hypothetical protein
MFFDYVESMVLTATIVLYKKLSTFRINPLPVNSVACRELKQSLPVGIKRLGRDAEQSHLSNVKVKKSIDLSAQLTA